MNRARFGLAGLLVALLVSSMPAHASVTATLHVSRHYHGGLFGLPWPLVDVRPPCAVSIAAGANGIQLLNAAHAAGCLPSYEIHTEYPGGSPPKSEVVCVEDMCRGNKPPELEDYWLYYDVWTVYENGQFSYDYANFGLERLRVDNGDSFVLSFDTWPRPIICPCI